MSEIYAQLLLDAAKHPSHWGDVSTMPYVATHHNASCGDQFQVGVTVNTESVVTDIRWQAQGCVISKAHMSALADLAVGKSVAAILQLQKSDLLALFGFDETLAPGREKCVLIGLKTLHRVLQQVPLNSETTKPVV